MSLELSSSAGAIAIMPDNDDNNTYTNELTSSVVAASSNQDEVTIGSALAGELAMYLYS